MTPGQRSAANRASWAALAISLTAIAAAYYWRAHLFADTYQVNVNIRTVAPAAAVAGNINAARAFVMRSLAGTVAARRYRDLGNSSAAETDGIGVLTGRTIGVENLQYRNTDRNALAQIPAMLGAKYDLQSEDSGHVDLTRDTEIVIVGPFLLFGPTDAAFLLEIGLLVVAFGALEIRGSDPESYPAGMHPFVVFCQILLIAAIAITLVAIRWHSAHPLLTAYIGILALANVALVRWLWITRDKWAGPIRASYWSIVAALMVVDIANALTLVRK